MESLRPASVALLVALSACAWCQSLAVEISAHRGEVCLNDAWSFMPAVAAAAESPVGEWGALRVPGSWAGASALPGVESKPEAAPWTGVDLEQLSRGWYEHDDKARAGFEGVAMIRKHDPTRAVFTHHGADIGDIHTCNNYLCLIPLQEREEWLSSYVEKADLPYLPIEFGTPLHPTFQRGRNGFGNTIVSEPLMTEFCAMYLGSRAYELESDEYRKRLQDTYEAPQRWRNWHGAPELEQAPAFQELVAFFVRNTWRSWRTWGVAAGMVPWSMAQGWQGNQGDYWVEVPMEYEPGRRGVQLQLRRRQENHARAGKASSSSSPAPSCR